MQITSFFNPFITISPDGTITAAYRNDLRVTGLERFNMQRHLIPSTDGTWIATQYHPATVRTAVLFTSAIDAMHFANHFRGRVASRQAIAYVALGLLPSHQQITAIRRHFPGARMALAFDNSLVGRVTDCKISAWSKGKNPEIHSLGGQLRIRYGRNTYDVPSDKLTLSYFEKLTGIRSGIRTYKHQ